MSNKQSKEDLFVFMSSLVSLLREEGRYGTAHVYSSTLRCIRRFEGGRKRLPFSCINAVWVSSFEGYLLSQGLSLNTVSTYLRLLRAVYNRGVKCGAAAYVPHLFSRLCTGVERGRSRALSVCSLRKLLRADSGLPVKLRECRDLFVLLFFMRGSCFSDLAYLRRCDLRADGSLSYRRRKTGRVMRILLPPEAIPVCKRCMQRESPASASGRSSRLFGFVRDEGMLGYRQYQTALRQFNKCLKQLASFLGIEENLSTYCARHSWATIANFCRYDKELISNAMGHSSVKVTETYFQVFRDDEIDRMNRGVIRYVMGEIKGGCGGGSFPARFCPDTPLLCR
ncbi:tyrosine-type recombinase/integrase [Bacteroides pyogenes]|uniref:tyrosine-type recombinase/integrase n=1 Tax=Bacteroides pyogenes TaxID=310300 RepID=UPI003B42F225